MEARRRELGEQVTPGVGRVREAVEAQDERPVLGPVAQAGELQAVRNDGPLAARHPCVQNVAARPPANVAWVNVTFYGVRGSCPCSGDRYRRYGGNTSCLVIDVEGDEPLIVDLGTGLRSLGDVLHKEVRALGTPMQATALLTHLHFDHILGIPFFGPLHDPGARLTVYGPGQPKGTPEGRAARRRATAGVPDPHGAVPRRADHRRPRRRGLLHRLGQDHGPARPARRDHPRLPHRGGGAFGRLHVRSPGAARPPGHPRGRARALRRGGPAHPRRPVHRRRVLGARPTGATRPPPTPCTSRRSPGRGASCSRTTTPPTPTASSIASSTRPGGSPKPSGSRTYPRPRNPSRSTSARPEDGDVSGLDQARFREVLGHFATGITVVTALEDGVPVGFTCQSFATLSPRSRPWCCWPPPGARRVGPASPRRARSA